jgi:RNA polymerase sigma-70 factor (ECF subfamily)
MRDELSDGELARRVAAGDEGALEVFYERYADPLFGFIYHHLAPQRADAEELWQETLLAALRSIGAYQGEGALFTWLCGIARHKISDYYRHRAHEADLFADVPEAEIAALTSSLPLPEEVVLRRATRVRVVEALGELPPAYREALVARYVDSREVEEVGRLLGRTYKATESLLSRAREAFRAALTRLEREKGGGR